MRPAGAHEPGKIQKAVWLLSQWPEEIEADLQRYYGVNFVDLFRRGSNLTWRRFLVLFEQLPPESATRTAIRNSIPEDELTARRDRGLGAEKAPWSSTEMLLAMIVDNLALLRWMYASANSKSKVPRPEPVPRPGIKLRGGRRMMTIEEIKTLDPRLRDLDDETAMERYREMTGRG